MKPKFKVDSRGWWAWFDVLGDGDFRWFGPYRSAAEVAYHWLYLP